MRNGREIYTEINSIDNKDNNFISYKNRIDNKEYSLICNVCYTIIGRFSMSVNLEFEIESNDLDNNILYKLDPYNINPSPRCKCHICNKIRKCFTVDANMGEIISLLNKNGIYTSNCCEGHTIDSFYSTPYILFKNIKDINLFDMSDDRLKYWIIRDYHDDMYMDGDFSLDLSDSINLKDLFNNKHINDLFDYIKEMIK